MRKNCFFDGVFRSEPIEGVSFTRSVDILVAGLGSGGCYAALAAAKGGASVLAFDRAAEFGGMSITGWVCGYYYGFRGGEYEDTDARAAEIGDLFFLGAMQPEARQIVLAEKFRACGVETLSQTVLTAIYMQEQTVVGAELFTDGEFLQVQCRELIDATSDGAVVRLCGVRTMFGRETDGTAAPFSAQTLCVTAEGGVSRRFGDSGMIDPFDTAHLTKKILLSRTHHLDHRKETGISVGTAELPGIREGLRFEGEEPLLYRDVISFRQPEKVLFYAYSDIDKHGHDTAIDEEDYQNYWVLSNLATLTIRIPVPYGAVIPRGVKGLITACRCLSVDAYVSSAVRMNTDMYRLGECVGIAAALAVRHGCHFAELPYALYHNAVENLPTFTGDPSKSHGFDMPQRQDAYVPVSFDPDADALRKGLDSRKPAAAIYSCLLHPEASLQTLLSVIDQPASELQELTAAIALGALGRKEALPALRKAVRNRAPVHFLDCRRSNQFPSVDAVCLLGRIGEAEDLDLLAGLLFDPEEPERKLYHTLEPAYIFSDAQGVNYVYYQHFTHAMMALLKLSGRLGVRSAYCGRIRALLSGASRERIRCAITPQEKGGYWYEAAEDFFDLALKQCR